MVTFRDWADVAVSIHNLAENTYAIIGDDHILLELRKLVDYASSKGVALVKAQVEGMQGPSV